jgi:hypothetical protein
MNEWRLRGQGAAVLNGRVGREAAGRRDRERTVCFRAANRQKRTQTLARRLAVSDPKPTSGDAISVTRRRGLCRGATVSRTRILLTIDTLPIPSRP